MQPKIIRIGRGETDAQGKPNNIVINDASISRAHLEVFIDPEGQVFITDLNSTNGTFVNGIAIKGDTVLKKGDVLKLGKGQIVHWEDWLHKSEFVEKKPKDEYFSTGSLDQLQIRSAKKSKAASIIIIASVAIVVILSTILILFKDAIFSPETENPAPDLILNKTKFGEKTFAEINEVVKYKPKVFEINSGDTLSTKDSIKVVVTIQNDTLTSLAKVEIKSSEEQEGEKNDPEESTDQKEDKNKNTVVSKNKSTSQDKDNNENTVNVKKNNTSASIDGPDGDGYYEIQIAKGGEKLSSLIARIKNTASFSCPNPGDQEEIGILNQNNPKVRADVKKKMQEDESYVVPAGIWIMFRCN